MSKSKRASVHRPVLLRETIEWLDLSRGLTVVDGTVGAGGHAVEIVQHIGANGRLMGCDRDPMMLEFAEARLSNHGNARTVQSSYADLDKVLAQTDLAQADRILVDLGLSSDQLADEQRGFGFKVDAPLDLRFDCSQGRPASELLATADRADLERVFNDYGEESFSRQIAEEVCRHRSRSPIQTTRQLVATIEAAIPASALRHARKHPATRVFQALRIAVNAELEQLQRALDETFPACLLPGGRLVVITFHSLEDRMVKQAFRRHDQWENLTPKPIVPSPTEQRVNPRSRSAKLRAAMRTTTKTMMTTGDSTAVKPGSPPKPKPASE